MGSGGDKVNEGTSYQPSEPLPCANGCGFFGTPATMNLCSKCHRDFKMKEQQAAAAKAALEMLVSPQDKATAAVAAAAAMIDVKPSPSTSSSSSESTEKVERQAEEAATDGGANKKGSNRCSCCNRKVGVTGFPCRCGSTFCGAHRYPEKHGCTFDYRGQGREAIARANPVVKGDKIQRF